MSNNYKNMNNKKIKERQKYKSIIALQMQLTDLEVFLPIKNNPSQGLVNKKTGDIKWRHAKNASVTT